MARKLASIQYVHDIWPIEGADRVEAIGVLGWRGVAKKGEFCGGGIQGNPLKLIKPEWYVFTIYDADTRRRWPLDEMIAFCDGKGFTHVPVEEREEHFDYDSVEALLTRASGKYESGTVKEGIVVRPIESVYSKILQASLSMKVINNDYLFKKGKKG